MIKTLILFFVAVSLILFTAPVLPIYSQSSATLTYPLLEGWNLVHFPIKPDTVSTAAGLVKTIPKAGGYVTTVATWNGGLWQEYVQRGANVYSADFPVIPGRAYFLRSHRELDWSVTGTPLPNPPTPKLNPGWNSVGLFPSPNQTASQFLTSLNQNQAEVATEIDWWHSGAWEVFVQRLFSPQNIQEYGENFTLSPQTGYMIKAQ